MKSEPKTWTTTLLGRQMQFQTDAGVFSKGIVDFGSRLLIEQFQLPSIEGPVLDIGCGYGPIGLTLALDNESRIVHMVDVNDRALLLARINAEKNNIENVMIYESVALQAVKTEGFSAILTNPPIRAGKDTVHAFYEQAYEKLAQEGELWVVIQKKQGAPSTEKKLIELFGNVEVVAKKRGYFIFRAVKI